MSNVNQLWDACAQSIRDQVSDGVWNSTFKEARPLSVTNDELVNSLIVGHSYCSQDYC